MPDSVLQSKTGQNAVSSSTLAITFDNNTRTGSTIMVGANVFDSGAGSPTWNVTDNKGNTYNTATATPLGALWNSNSDRVFLAAATNASGGATHIVTITVSGSGNTFTTAVITEISGNVSVSNAGQTNTGLSTSPSTSDSSTKPIWAVVACNGSAPTITEGTNYTLDGEIEAPTAGHGINMAHKLAGPTTSPSWTLGSSVNWGAASTVMTELPFQDAIWPQPCDLQPIVNVVSYGSGTENNQ